MFRRYEGFIQVFDERSGIYGRTKGNKERYFLEVASARSGIELRGEKIAFLRADNRAGVYG